MRVATWLARAALGGASVALVVRFILVGDASWTYNEATYVELARHPWWSSYYPDTVFLRHPPLAFVAMALWGLLPSEAEWLVRLPALLLVLTSVALLWDAARRHSARAAALVGVVVGAAWPLHSYALEATMYPYALAAGSLAVWAHAAGRERLTAWALVAFAMSHLFGFLFLAFWAWPRRHEAWLRPVLAVPLAWLVLATGISLALNTSGDIMRLGPLGQALRGGGTTGDAVIRPVVHVASAALAWWILNPALWRGAVRSVWRWPVVLLLAYMLLGAPYPRYALLVLPFIVVAGATWLISWSHPARGTLTAAAVAVALLSIPAGSWYIDGGPDPRAAGDVPGVQDWAAAVDLLGDVDRVQTSSPTSTAYYLGLEGFRVVDRRDAPYTIHMDGPHPLTVVRVDAADELGSGPAIVPAGWVDGCRTVRGLAVCVS